MPFEFNRYSAILLIFFVHGFVYAFLLARKGFLNRQPSSKWLALFLLCGILYICPWMLGFAGWYEGSLCLNCRNFLFYAPLQHTLVMGPAIYFYVQSVLNPSFQFTRRDWLHFLPAFLYILWTLIVFVTDRIILKRYFLMNGEIDPDFDSWYIIAGLISLLVYGLLSYRHYRRFKQYIVEQVSFADELTFKWIRNFLVAFFVYFLANLIFHLLGLLGLEFNYLDTWWYYLFFALLLYYIIVNGYGNAIQTDSRLRFKLETPILPESTHPAPALETPAGQAADQPISPTTPKDALELEPWKEKIQDAVWMQKQYRNAELTLADLARTLDTNTALVSRVINQGFGMNFNDFINRYRVEEVKERLTDSSSSQFTIMSLAYEAGFNSKATFNRAFKKFTGKNPSDFNSQPSQIIN